MFPPDNLLVFFPWVSQIWPHSWADSLSSNFHPFSGISSQASVALPWLSLLHSTLCEIWTIVWPNLNFLCDHAFWQSRLIEQWKNFDPIFHLFIYYFFLQQCYWNTYRSRWRSWSSHIHSSCTFSLQEPNTESLPFILLSGWSLPPSHMEWAMYCLWPF